MPGSAAEAKNTTRHTQVSGFCNTLISISNINPHAMKAVLRVNHPRMKCHKSTVCGRTCERHHLVHVPCIHRHNDKRPRTNGSRHFILGWFVLSTAFVACGVILLVLMRVLQNPDTWVWRVVFFASAALPGIAFVYFEKTFTLRTPSCSTPAGAYSSPRQCTR